MPSLCRANGKFGWPSSSSFSKRLMRMLIKRDPMPTLVVPPKQLPQRCAELVIIISCSPRCWAQPRSPPSLGSSPQQRRGGQETRHSTAEGLFGEEREDRAHRGGEVEPLHPISHLPTSHPLPSSLLPVLFSFLGKALPCMCPAKTRILLQTPCALLPFTSPASTHSPSMHRLEESTQREGHRCSRAGLSAAAKPGAAESLPDQRPIRAPRTSCRAPQALSASLSCSNSPCPQGLGAAHISLHSQGAPWIIWAATKLQIGVMPVEVGGTCVHAACSQGWTHSTKHRLVGGDMAKTPQLHTWPQTWGERGTPGSGHAGQPTATAAGG